MPPSVPLDKNVQVPLSSKPKIVQDTKQEDDALDAFFDELEQDLAKAETTKPRTWWTARIGAVAFLLGAFAFFVGWLTWVVKIAKRKHF